MGMFDSVMVRCPNCGTEKEFQSKAGHCNLDSFDLDTAATEMLWDILNQPEFCRGCRRWFAVVDPRYPDGAPPRPEPIAALLSPQPETPQQLSCGQYYWPYDRVFTFADLARDSDGSGEAGVTGTGTTEGNSAGRQASPVTHSDQEQKG